MQPGTRRRKGEEARSQLPRSRTPRTRHSHATANTATANVAPSKLNKPRDLSARHKNLGNFQRAQTFGNYDIMIKHELRVTTIQQAVIIANCRLFLHNAWVLARFHILLSMPMEPFAQDAAWQMANTKIDFNCRNLENATALLSASSLH